MKKKNYFGDDHEIMYGTVINHDAYAYLRITLEVPRGQDTESIVMLNNKEIGKVIVEKTPKATLGYKAFRKQKSKFVEIKPTKFKELGLAVACIISDLI